MSVSWQPSQHASLPLGVRLGGPSTSSSDYGSWFQPRTTPALPTPSAAAIPRRQPTRKLGALSFSEPGPGGQPEGCSQRDGDADQYGRVNSFLSKVSQEGRVPRSPRTPELLDLPGRIVRAPRTRHMTPRNSPDAARYPEIGDEGQGHSSMMGMEQSQNQTVFPYSLERSNTMADMSPRIHGELQTQSNPFTLQRSNTMMHPGSVIQPKPSQSHGSQYTIPRYPFERSNTMTSIQMPGNNRYDLNPQFGSTEVSPRPGLQRAGTMIEASKFTPAITPEQQPADQRVSWSFKRVPSFHGGLPGGQQPGITRRPLETFQPEEERKVQRSQYMFSHLPNSNVIKSNAEADPIDPAHLKPRMPMYWLYGSRGRPGGVRDDPTWAPANSPRDAITAFSQSGQSIIENGTGNNNAISESDFLATGTDRRDAYRSNYSSHLEQRTQSEPDRTEFTRDPSAGETASLPDEPKVKSILKKSPMQGTAGRGQQAGTYPMRTGPGGRLPHLSLTRRNTSKRVTFAM